MRLEWMQIRCLRAQRTQSLPPAPQARVHQMCAPRCTAGSWAFSRYKDKGACHPRSGDGCLQDVFEEDCSGVPLATGDSGKATDRECGAQVILLCVVVLACA